MKKVLLFRQKSFEKVFIIFSNSLEKVFVLCYIGEAEKILTRLKQHLQDENYWNDCIAIVMGRNANGRTEWKTQKGKTLKDLEDGKDI